MSKFTIDDLAKQEGEEEEIIIDIKENDEYQKTYDVYKSEIEEKHPFTPGVLEKIVSGYSNFGNYKKACELQNIVYNVRKEVLGENSLDTLKALSDLAVFYNYLGYHNKALELKTVVCNKLIEILGENHLDTLTELNNLASFYCDLGDYNKACELQNTVYNARRKILGESHPETLSVLRNLICSYSHLGDYHKWCELLQNIIYNAYKYYLGKNFSGKLSALHNLVDFYSDSGDYIKASELQNQYNAYKEISEEIHLDILSALHNLAGLYSDLGDYNTALEMRNVVYNARKEILGEKHLDTLSALHNLASSYSDIGDYNTALEMRNAVYNARKEILGEKHLDTLSALHNLAISYSDLGDYNTALEIRNTVYNARKEILGESHPDTLSALANLAVFYSYLGHYDKTFELQNTVYNICKEVQETNHPYILIALTNLARSYSYLGDYGKACELQYTVYNASKENLGESHPNTLFALSNLLVSQIYQEKTDNQSIKKHMTTYFENINNLKTTAFNIKEVSSRRNFLESYNNVYKLLKSCVFERNIKDLLDYLFINKNLSFEMDVNRFHNETMGERLSLEEVSHVIGNQLIIDFYELDNSKYGLILVKEGKYSYHVVDYADIINGSFMNNEGIHSFIGSFGENEHIYICPDGKLYNISFERILNNLNISYLSSVQTLYQDSTTEDNNNQLVSFVYPDFSGTQSEDNDRGDTKGVLYGSYLEGMFIHDIYGEKSTIYSSYQANHDNFFNTKRPRILHVSTHGDYLDNEHMEPMDRGILCLSGYNVEDNSYGYISAKEIQYMDLKGTELVVLSACNTGLGENISGEGIYGIRRAFELAGCQTLLLTVEEVDDYNSAIFMKSFYERYNQTNNIYQSFKDTKEYLKEHGLKELKELRDVFEKEMKNKIKNPFVYTRNLNELNKRIEESETIGQIVRKKNNQYIQEDWNGFIIQGKIENCYEMTIVK